MNKVKFKIMLSYYVYRVLLSTCTLDIDQRIDYIYLITYRYYLVPT
jgi:hypothetical protein